LPRQIWSGLKIRLMRILLKRNKQNPNPQS
jgi:hypothetical protein